MTPRALPLIVQDLAIARGQLPVLEGVTFSLAAGQALILRGPNGIGKTTLLRTLAGLQPPRAGLITNGGDQLAYAGHADGIKPTLTVTENLRFWAQIFGHTNIDRAIAAFDLTALGNRPAGALSAGQKRRLGLARLLVTNRPVWIMDEPTVSLDQSAVALFGATIESHLAAGGSALIATHIDLGLTADLLDLTPFRAALARLDTFDEAFL